ncbi:MAG: hypothetical protein NZ551_05465 [Microscillaceae bacterium]|nr:hypothetical protein [Microscillaceae bacterium]MDW8460644.1 hypothetical protein [Cytophagales bacterium]
MNKVALIIIYNHQYNQNISILEDLYCKRFSFIYHLMPFYEGDKENVIPVYENSFYFQGYVAQGAKIFFNKSFTHYFFIADDILLNPAINETNFDKYFGIENDTCYMPGAELLQKSSNGYWMRYPYAYWYRVRQLGLEVEKLLPTREQAHAKLKSLNLLSQPLYFHQVFRHNFEWKHLLSLRMMYYLVRFYLRKIMQGRKPLQFDYPFAHSYSDIFLVNASSIKKFALYCGIFAAGKLFAEIALPTALALASEKIVTDKDLTMRGMTMWTEKDYSALDKYNYNLEALLSDFPQDILYIHPIKLSKWIKK